MATNLAGERTYYQILKVSKDSPIREVKRAYHQLARKYHPDKASSTEEQQQFEEEFALISEAYNVLKDDDRRKEYDAKLKKETDAMREATLSGEKTSAKPSTKSFQRPITASDVGIEKSRVNIAQKAFVKGCQLYQIGEFHRAIEFFEAAIQNNPHEASYHAKLAMALIKARRGFTKSVEACKRACELDAYSLEYKMNLGDIYAAAGSRSLAAKQYEEVLRWDSSNTSARQKLDAIRGPSGDSFLSKLMSRFKK
ncbi:DnaJ domain-containing protein [Candidatus Sumerlaeota bacterium]|nr:DnaJ domain-containing protein [Candidatus Sumerlaeota bacterium]